MAKQKQESSISKNAEDTANLVASIQGLSSHTSIQMTQVQVSQVLPNAEELKRLEDIIPGVGQQFLVMAKDNLVQRHNRVLFYSVLLLYFSSSLSKITFKFGFFSNLFSINSFLPT